MNKGNNIYEELKSMDSPLATMPRTMPYTLPHNYFNDLDGNIQSAIADCNAPDMAHQLPVAKMPHGIPAGYFEELPIAIMGEIAHQHLKSENVPQPYAVPAGYFDRLPVKVMEAAKLNEAVRPKRINIRLKRWAAAAAIIIGVGFGGYKMLEPHRSGSDAILAAVPNPEIKEYLQHNMRVDVSNIVTGSDNNINNIDVDNKDIIRYLNETGWDVVD